MRPLVCCFQKTLKNLKNACAPPIFKTLKLISMLVSAEDADRAGILSRASNEYPGPHGLFCELDSVANWQAQVMSGKGSLLIGPFPKKTKGRKTCPGRITA